MTLVPRSRVSEPTPPFRALPSRGVPTQPVSTSVSPMPARRVKGHSGPHDDAPLHDGRTPIGNTAHGSGSRSVSQARPPRVAGRAAPRVNVGSVRAVLVLTLKTPQHVDFLQMVRAEFICLTQHHLIVAVHVAKLSRTLRHVSLLLLSQASLACWAEVSRVVVTSRSNRPALRSVECRRG